MTEATASSLHLRVEPDEELLLSPRVSGARGEDPVWPSPLTMPLARLLLGTLRMERLRGGAQGRDLELVGPLGSRGRWHVLTLGPGEAAVVPLGRVVGWTSAVRLSSSVRLAPITLPLFRVLRLPVFTGPGRVLLHAGAELLPAAPDEPFFLPRLAVWGPGVRLRPSLMPASTARGLLFRLLLSPVRVVGEGQGPLVLEGQERAPGGERQTVFGLLLDGILRILRPVG